MNRKLLVLLIFVDLIFLGGVGHQLWNRYQVLQGQAAASTEEEMMDDVAVDLEVAAVAPPVQTAPPPPPAAPSPAEADPVSQVKQKRTFVFQGRAAKSVQLVGDFNQWTPQAFQKGKKGQWSVSVFLAPGDYSYNFIVDGKTIRDPNQRRTDMKERSLLTVSP